MSRDDAFEEEMDRFRSLRPEDEERLVQGEAPSEELAEIAAFARALRAALLEPAPPALAASLSPRLAEAARAGAAAPAGRRSFAIPSPRVPRPVLRVALAVAAIPLLFTGLAFAGVTLPDPARSAFETLGIELPSQPADDDDTEGTAKDGDSAGSATGQENSAGKLGHGRSEPNPARAGGGAQGKQGKGRALGKRGLAPGLEKVPGSRGSPQGQGKAATPPAGGQPPFPPASGDSGSSGGAGSPPVARGQSGGAGGLGSGKP